RTDRSPKKPPTQHLRHLQTGQRPLFRRTSHDPHRPRPNHLQTYLPPVLPQNRPGRRSQTAHRKRTLHRPLSRRHQVHPHEHPHLFHHHLQHRHHRLPVRLSL